MLVGFAVLAALLSAGALAQPSPEPEVTADLAPSAPSRGRYLDPVFEEVEVVRDVPYRRTVDDLGNPVELRLDVYEPAGDVASQRPAIVWMPGDRSWFSADEKDDVTSYAEAFARRGYVAVTLDYRMRPGLRCCPTRHADGMSEAILDGYDDAKAGIAWLQEHAVDHRVDPEAIASGGTSAGATNSLGLAHPPDDVGDEPGTTGIAAAVAVSGNGYGRPPAATTGGDSRGANRGGTPPVLAFHGSDDDLAPAHLSERACAAAVETGARCDVVTYPSSGHEIATTRRQDVVSRSVDFLADVMLAPGGYVDPLEGPAGGRHPDPEAPGGDGAAGTPPEAAETPTAVRSDSGNSRGFLPRTGSDVLVVLLRVGLVLAVAGLAALGWAYLRRRRAAAVGGVTGLLLALVTVAGTASSPEAAAADDAADGSGALQTTAAGEDGADGSAGGDPSQADGSGQGDPGGDGNEPDDTVDTYLGDVGDDEPGGDGTDGDDGPVDGGSPDPGPGDLDDRGEPNDRPDDGGQRLPEGFPEDWTGDQAAYAEALIADTEAGLRMYRNPAILPMLGFEWITDGRNVGEYQHWVNIGWVADDRLSPEHPEALVFHTTEDQPRPVPEAAMYILMTFGMENIPDDIAWLPGWHIHDNLCFDGLDLTGLADEDGDCERGVVQLTPPMLHVWGVDTPCGRFAGFDEHGLRCR